VPKKDISEPSFGFGRGGDREFVLPGNREYVAGDRIPGPKARAAAVATAAAARRKRGRLRVLAVTRRVHADLLRRPRAAQPRAHRNRARCAKEEHSGRAIPSPACPQISRVSHAAAVARAPDRAFGRHRREAEAIEAAFAVAVAAGHAARAAELHNELERLLRRRRKLPFLDEVDLATATASGNRSRSRAPRCSA
jgi:uncharacterized sporulation protein YeaH/YhbH (DUF444 family)